MLSITYRSKVMERQKFYHQIDDWVAYNFVKIDAPLPHPSFIRSFLSFVEDEFASKALSDRGAAMPWEQVSGKDELDDLLPKIFTTYLNVRSLA
jgi:hypothetical protein|tara:strand:+ start:1160 stop:1441 length:282 start_codon:yes stop_codon:yes gene_type:complete